MSIEDCETCKYAIWDSEEYHSGKSCGLPGPSSRAFVEGCKLENDPEGCDDYKGVPYEF